jgi:hypothetical protein
MTIMALNFALYSYTLPFECPHDLSAAISSLAESGSACAFRVGVISTYHFSSEETPTERRLVAIRPR